MTESLAGAMDQSQRQERRRALRALLRRPLLDTRAPDFPLVRRHLEWLREWLSRNPAWRLHFDGRIARLYKIPADTRDGSRPAREPKSGQPFSRRRYVVLCLALAALERSDRQTALGRLADDIQQLAAADPALAEAGLTLDLEGRDQRRDLVHGVRLLLDYGVLSRVEGDEEAFLAARGDVLYDIHRGALAAMLSARCGPSLIESDDAEARLAKLIEEPLPEGSEARNRRLRSFLTRKLVDDPVLYYDQVDDEQLAYLQGQRHALTRQIAEATGLIPEVRAEGLAMVDERDDLTDLGLPEAGTDGHVALLVAERLAHHATEQPGRPIARAELEAYVATLVETYGARWRKDARAPGGEVELTRKTLVRLRDLALVHIDADGIVPRPAIGRFALDAPTKAVSSKAVSSKAVSSKAVSSKAVSSKAVS